MRTLLVRAEESDLLSRDPASHILRFVIFGDDRLVLGNTAAHIQLGVVGFRGGVHSLHRRDFEVLTVGWWLDTLVQRLLAIGTIHSNGTVERWHSPEFDSVSTPKRLRSRLLRDLRSALSSWNQTT